MDMGDFGYFNRWSTKDKLLGMAIYDEAHKKSRNSGGGNKNKKNSGCLSVIAIIVAVGAFLVSAIRF